MIGRLVGRVTMMDDTTLVLDVSGVGYEVEVTTMTLAKVGLGGEQVELFTHLGVRDDAFSLYGFTSVGERDLFRALIKVNGVGPKLAMTLLSSLSPNELVRCVSDQDASILTKVSGVGRKTADRLLMELKDRLDDLSALESVSLASDHAAEEAVNALVSLGWRLGEARQAVDAGRGEGQSTEEIIRAALKFMANSENAT